MLRGEKEAKREALVVNHSISGMFAIRDGHWKLVLGNGSGGREKPSGKPFTKPYQLFNLSDDIAEENNLIEQHPKVADRLEKVLEDYRNSGRSVNR